MMLTGPSPWIFNSFPQFIAQLAKRISTPRPEKPLINCTHSDLPPAVACFKRREQPQPPPKPLLTKHITSRQHHAYRVRVWFVSLRLPLHKLRHFRRREISLLSLLFMSKKEPSHPPSAPKEPTAWKKKTNHAILSTITTGT